MEKFPASGKGKPGSFYVTESRDLSIDLIDFLGYEINII